jgi:membrane protein YdbS with pleckstrin-like domain
MDSSATDTVADGVARQLDPRWITVQRIHAAVATVILAFASFVGVLMLWAASGIPSAGLFLLPVWALLIAGLAWHLYRWPATAYRFASYRVDKDGLEILRGVYWRTITSVARSRVQHTDVSQGPLERRHGLGTLVVYTAGTQHAQMKLAGLDFGVARRIRAHLLPDSDSDAV